MKATLQKETHAQERAVEYISPEVNIYETKDGYVLQAEMPGVGKDGLEVTLEGNEITIVGHRRLPDVTGIAVLRESHQADFRRVFELDPVIDSAKVVARMDQGVLTLTLPKSERVKPRRISVD